MHVEQLRKKKAEAQSVILLQYCFMVVQTHGHRPHSLLINFGEFQKSFAVEKAQIV